MNKWNLNKSQRMQIKAFICLLGFIFIIILLLAKLIFSFVHKEPEIEPPIPVEELLSNVWIMEADKNGIMVFCDGIEENYSYSELEGMAPIVAGEVREQVADVLLTDGKVTEITVKNDKINGKILGADAENVELEGYGKVPLATDYKGYRIYNTLEMCTVSDLAFGYNFADFVMEDGEICGILIAKEQVMEYIRVLVKASDYSGIFHESVVLTSDTDFTVQYGEYQNRQTENYGAGEEITITRESSCLSQGRMVISPNVLTGKLSLNSVNRSQGTPGYRGSMELIRTPEGIVVINEVLLEEYLYSVVPSEMPASFPDEALQAQAICARTYGYEHMLHAGYPQYGAHVDDSTSYQVYNNILEQEATTTAVKDTYGQILYTGEGNLAGAYYYSTSCGIGTDANVWKTEEARTLTYLQPKPVNRDSMQGTVDNLGEKLQDETAFAEFIAEKRENDFEVDEGWYRWKYQVEELDASYLSERLQKRFQTNEKLVLTLQDGEYVSAPIEAFSEITNLYIAARGVGGVADELVIESREHTYKVISEHNIRYVLNDGVSKVIRQDGSEITSPYLLPSGFFVLSPNFEKKSITGYTLTGGGFGHGVGMSQNGAKRMAKENFTAEQILAFFFEGCVVEKIYES